MSNRESHCERFNLVQGGNNRIWSNYHLRIRNELIFYQIALSSKLKAIKKPKATEKQ